MNSAKLESNLGRNAHRLATELADDAKAEARHIADPSQCGVIVRRHFDGLMIALYVFILLFLLAAVGCILLYVRH